MKEYYVRLISYNLCFICIIVICIIFYIFVLVFNGVFVFIFKNVKYERNVLRYILVMLICGEIKLSCI